jgi:hypothetical protein
MKRAGRRSLRCSVAPLFRCSGPWHIELVRAPNRSAPGPCGLASPTIERSKPTPRTAGGGSPYGEPTGLEFDGPVSQIAAFGDALIQLGVSSNVRVQSMAVAITRSSAIFTSATSLARRSAPVKARPDDRSLRIDSSADIAVPPTVLVDRRARRLLISSGSVDEGNPRTAPRLPAAQPPVQGGRCCSVLIGSDARQLLGATRQAACAALRDWAPGGACGQLWGCARAVG